MTAASSSTGPMNVLNIRLKRRGGPSGEPSSGHLRPSSWTMPGSRFCVSVRISVPGSSSSRNRWLFACALHQRVTELRDVAGRDPYLRVHQDARVEADDVVALLDHGAPPGALDVVLELDAERPVIPHGVDAAVDLAAREDEAAPLGERHDRFERGDRGLGIRHGGNLLEAPSLAWPVADADFRMDVAASPAAGRLRLR